jgi:hypothetical protein
VTALAGNNWSQGLAIMSLCERFVHASSENVTNMFKKNGSKYSFAVSRCRRLQCLSLALNKPS